MNNPPWPQEREDLLRKLYGEGMSYKVIAARLDVPRNAVAGKVSRLKLPKRDYTPDHSAALSRASAKRKAINVGKLQEVRDGLPMKTKTMPSMVVVEAKPPLNVSIVEAIERRGCKWPGSEFLKVCGHVKHDDRYCEPHVRASGRAE
jgi:hypothetical protein